MDLKIQLGQIGYLCYIMAEAVVPPSNDDSRDEHLMEFSGEPAANRKRLLFLGTGTSVGVPIIGCDCAVCTSDDPKNNRTRPSVLIKSAQGNLLIDTSPDLRTQLLREKISRVDAVLYTHFHADHVFGFDDLRVFGKYLEADLPIYCEPAVEEFIRTAFSYAFDPIVLKYPAGGVPRVAFHRIERPSVNVLDHQIVPVPLRHGRYDVLGFRFGNMAYCTDVNHIPETSWPLLKGLDLLVLDALRHEPHATHFSLGQALEAIDKLKPKRALLTHLSCRMDPQRAEEEMPANVSLAYDGLEVEF